MSSSQFWDGRSVFVTGGTGLLGSFLVPALVKRGAVVVALVRDGMPTSRLVQEGWLQRVVSVTGSMTDADLVRRSLSEYQVDTVFHLAAQTQVMVGQADPVGTLDANVRGTWTVLDAARQTKVREVIVASSDKAYGEPIHLPYREDHPLQGRFPYDVSKSCTDLLTQMYAHSFKLRAGVVRCGNLFGGGDLNFLRLIPGVIQSTLENKNFIIRSDGKVVRDFLYVEDAVEAYLCLAEKLAGDDSLIGEAFNFGLGIRITMLELAEKVLKMMGREDLRPDVRNTFTSELREQFLDATKAQTRLGWKPTVGLDEGLRRTIDWYRTYFAEKSKQPR
jgi:CDP-glucose 4,6-dehydratase